MTPARWQKIESLLQAALECKPAERGAFLGEACAGDDALRKEVESLLASSDEVDEFLKLPVIEDAAALFGDSSRASTIGPNIGPYSILSKLGAGGMGEVHLARDSRLARNVALKLLDPDLIDNSQQRMRFLREARLASALDHPNVCTIHEVGEAAGRLFIAMQYVEGLTLKQVISGRPLDLASLLSIGLQVADALSAAHSQGIVHRDIKPGNIIITGRGQVKVLDFGLAKLFETAVGDAGAELTKTGAVLGTPNYMSPEQARGERTNHRGDIFSFGVVLYEMATGRAPFKAKSQPETLNAVINQPHAPVNEMNKEAPPGLAAIVDRALAKDPADRYQSMGEMIQDLRELARGAGLVGSAGLDGGNVPLVPRPRRAALRWPAHWSGARLWFLILSITTVALLGVAAAVYFTRPRPAAPAVTTPAVKSIAVLPFKPVVASSRDESLEMGMADTLITRLSNIKQIIVRPISAVRNYGELDQDAMAAGREQRVDAVLDGNIQKSGEQVRVTVRLVNVADGQQLWADKFDEKMTNIFAVQDSISRKVTDALAVKLSGEERELLTKRYTDNAEAYQLYLKGRYYQSSRTEEGLKKGIEFFEQAIARDPSYALAFSGLADSYSYLGNHGFLPPNEASPIAKQEAMKALKIDETLAEAHTSLAYVRMNYDWDWPGAGKEYERAIELDPGYTKAHSLYAWYLAAQGRFDEAIAEMKRSLEIDPLSLYDNTNLGWHLYMSRRYAQAIEQLQMTLDMEPNFAQARIDLGQVYEQEKMYEQAVVELQKAMALYGGSPTSRAALGHAYAIAGKKGEARRVVSQLKDLSKRKHVSSYDIAIIYTGLGETEQAFAWLEKAYKQRDGWLAGRLKVDPRLDNLRSDPRLADLMRRVGLTP
ncbi:MAG: protein kinase [Blastocatellia bacterium]